MNVKGKKREGKKGRRWEDIDLEEIDQELEKYGLTKEQYEACLADIRDKVSGAKDMDWEEIAQAHNLEIHRDTLRKASQTIFGGVFVSKYFAEKNATKDADRGYLAELRVEKEQLKRERQKLSDEKLEYNRWLREHARDELICEKICESVQKLLPLKFPEARVYECGNRESILCFADTHYGTEFVIKGLFGETLNEYNPEVFEKRMSNLLNQVLGTVSKNGITRLKVFSLGDEIDGILRVSQLMKLRYGVVESTIKYAEFISNWLNELSNHVFIDFYSVAGNHSELRMIGQPKGTFVNDNMSFVIDEFIKERLKNNRNFCFHQNDSGLIFEKVCGYNILGIHGEVKNMDVALQKFTNTYGTMIDILVGGHKHHFCAETVGIDKDIISVPSIIGIDDYSMSIGKTSNPGAIMFTVEEGKGIIEQRNYKL